MKERKIKIDNFEYILALNSKVIGLLTEDKENFSVILNPSSMKSFNLQEEPLK